MPKCEDEHNLVPKLEQKMIQLERFFPSWIMDFTRDRIIGVLDCNLEYVI